MILKMVNNRTDAEDLMFEAFEKAFASLNYYSPQCAFSTWLFKIASNNTIDFIRKRKAQTVSLDVDDINPEDRGYINVFRLMSERRMKKRFVSNVPILCGKRSLF